MNKWVVTLLVLCFSVNAVVLAFPLADFYLYANKESPSYGIYFLLISIGLVVSLVISILRLKYSDEYKRAEKIAYTPYTKYGLYALVFFFVSMICFYLYAFLLHG